MEKEKHKITVLNNALRPNPCFRQITGLRSLMTDNGHDLIQVIHQMSQRIAQLERIIFNLRLSNLKDVNLDGTEDNAQLGYDSESKFWVPFNPEKETSPEDIIIENKTDGENEDIIIENKTDGENEDIKVKEL